MQLRAADKRFRDEAQPPVQVIKDGMFASSPPYGPSFSRGVSKQRDYSN